MKIISFGSANIDRVLNLDHFPRIGESMFIKELGMALGGKGMNQTVAIARAGSEVYYGGKIGPDGQFVLDSISNDTNIRLDYLRRDEKVQTGQAYVLVGDGGDNIGLVYSGSNSTITIEEIDETMSHFGEGDILVAQNETSHIDHLLEVAGKKGMTIFFTPAPFKDELIGMEQNRYVDWFLLNQIEGECLSETKGTPEEVCKALVEKYPGSKVVLTLGEKGSICFDGKDFINQPAYEVQTVDTTGAGDTFAGYFISSIANSRTIKEALDLASRASAIQVTRPGASPAIPVNDEVEKYIF